MELLWCPVLAFAFAFLPPEGNTAIRRPFACATLLVVALALGLLLRRVFALSFIFDLSVALGAAALYLCLGAVALGVCRLYTIVREVPARSP